MPNLLRQQVHGFLNDRDPLYRIISPQEYGGNWYYWSDELRKRGFKIESIRG